jgi:acyl-CoA reductase-like NAD-dependent aldehyde dehydrogenase
MTVIGAVFWAVGTAGQRCTSTSYNHSRKYYDKVKNDCFSIQNNTHRNPLDENNHVGPIDKHAVEM